LPDVLDIVSVSSHTEIVHITVNGRNNGFGPLRKGGAANTIETGLTGFHFHQHQVGSFRCSADGFHAFDF
jgi:hypothetical protein